MTTVDGGAVAILDPRCCGLYDFRLSADGMQVLYTVRAGPPGGISTSLWHVAMDGSSGPTQISEELGGIDYAFSPDGTRAFFRDSMFSMFSSTDLYVARLDGEPSTHVLAPFVSQFAVSHDSTRVVYTSWPSTFTASELFVVPSDGGQPVRLSGALVAGGNVAGAGSQPAFAISADDRHVVYRADQEIDGVFSLYCVPLHGRGAPRRIEQSGVERFALSANGAHVVFAARDSATEPLQLFSAPLRLPLDRRATDLLSTPAVRLSAPMPAGGGLVDFALSPDSLGVVYSARQESLAIELFRVPLDGGAPPVKLNAPLTENGNVDGFVRPAFRIDPTSQRVVYRADQVFDEVHELFVVPLAGGAAQRVHAPLARNPTAGTVTSFALANDSQQVLFQASGDTAGVFELYRVPRAGGPDERINLPLAPGANVTPGVVTSPDGRWAVYSTLTPHHGHDLWSFDLTGNGPPNLLGFNGFYSIPSSVTADSQRVVFLARNEAGVNELCSRLLDGSGPAVELSEVGNRGGAFRLTPDGRRVVYQGDHLILSKLELFSAPVDGSAPPVRVSGVLNAFADVVASEFNLEAFQLSADSQWVVFLADRDVNEHFELYRAPVDGSAAPVKLNGKIVPFAGDVLRFALSARGDRVVYLADGFINDRVELYSTPLLGSPHARSTDDSARRGRVKLSGRITSVDPGVSSFQLSPRGDFVVYDAGQLGDAVPATYCVPIDGSEPARRLGKASSNWRFTLDGRRLLYCGEQSHAGVVELFSALLDGSQPPVMLNPPLGPFRQVRSAGFPGESSLQLTPDGRRVVYMADQNVNHRLEIFVVPVDGSGPALVVNGPLATGGDVGVPDTATASYRITADGREVVYLADHDENDVLELYVAPLP